MKKILIIEDEKVISLELQTLLKNYGYDAMILNDFNDVKNKTIPSEPIIQPLRCSVNIYTRCLSQYNSHGG